MRCFGSAIIVSIVLTLVGLFVPHDAVCGGPPGRESVPTVSAKIRNLLGDSGKPMSYDNLMEIYGLMTSRTATIPGLEEYLMALIEKRNSDPRVDQMILIFTARVIGQCHAPLSNAVALFDALIAQESRMNEWVLSFVADALARYPFDLESGVRLVSELEALHRRVKQRDGASRENFGYHFLPPPKTHAVRSYIGTIVDRRLREMERNRYYALIQKGFREEDIASSLGYLRQRGLPDTGEPCDPPMRCLIQHQGGIPFGSTPP